MLSLLSDDDNKKEFTLNSWKSANGGMAVVKMGTFLGAKNLVGGLNVLRDCIQENGEITMPPGESTDSSHQQQDQEPQQEGENVPVLIIPTYTPEQMEQHRQTIRQLSNTKSYHLYNYNIPDPIPPDMKIPIPPPECADASIPHRLLEVLTTLRLRYEETGGVTDSYGGHSAAATGDSENNTSLLNLDAGKLAAAAGGTYDEDADPMNAPEVVNAVLEFKRSLEERDVKSRKRRVDIITEAMGRKVRELVEKGRMEREMRKRMANAAGGAATDANGGDSGAAAPPVAVDGKVEDSGKRGVSNLPAWMTKGADGATSAPAEAQPPTDAAAAAEEDSKKRKFVPSEANRDDINVRKQRIDMAGASMSEIRAANQAADKLTTKEEILAPSTMFPPLSASATAEQIKSYVTTKIVDYLGEEESTLIGFIMKELGKGVKTTALLEEMKMVLDEDAEEFVLGLYKRLSE